MGGYQSIENKVTEEEIARLTLDLVRTPSPTGNEIAACRFYAEKLKEFGLEVKLDDTVARDRPNIIGTIRGTGSGRNLLLCGHIDTIPEGNCTPARIEGDDVYGRGSADMKGSLAAMAIAARAIIKSGTKLDGDLILAAYVDHEGPVGHGAGPRAIASSIRRGQMKVDGVVITEGVLRDQIGIAIGGIAIFKIKVRGPSASVHTQSVPIRSNPISWTSEVIREIVRMDEELNSNKWNPLIPERPCLQFGVVSGGDFYNRLPLACEVEGTIRWDPEEDAKDVANRLQTRIQRLQNTIWHSMDSSARLDVEVVPLRDSCQVPKDTEIVKSFQRATKIVSGREFPFAGTRMGGDLAIFYKEGGVPSLFYGNSYKAHSDNESISIKDLTMASRIYAALTLEFCRI